MHDATTVIGFGESNTCEIHDKDQASKNNRFTRIPQRGQQCPDEPRIGGKWEQKTCDWKRERKRECSPGTTVERTHGQKRHATRDKHPIERYGQKPTHLHSIPRYYMPSFLRRSISFCASGESFFGNPIATRINKSPRFPRLVGTPRPFMRISSP